MQYDAVGNLVREQGPTSGPSGVHTSTYTYDNLDRLILAIDPEGGETRYSYTAGDKVEEVTDPRGFKTVYTYDFQNRLVQVESEVAADEWVSDAYTYDA